MEIKELLNSIPDSFNVEPKGIVNALLKHHYGEVYKIYERIKEFRKEDPLTELIKIEQEFADLLKQYQGIERLTNPVFDLKVGALSKKQKKMRAKADDYQVLTMSDAEHNIRHYLETVHRIIQNNSYPLRVLEKDEQLTIKMIELVKKNKE